MFSVRVSRVFNPVSSETAFEAQPAGKQLEIEQRKSCFVNCSLLGNLRIRLIVSFYGFFDIFGCVNWKEKWVKHVSSIECQNIHLRFYLINHLSNLELGNCFDLLNL